MTGRILIADWQATNRITLKVRLSAACYDIQTANSLDQTLALACAKRPDLVIIGSGLPASEQIAACRMLRADPVTAPIPLVILCREEHRLAAMRAGASAVLDPQEDELMMLARVRGLLRDATPIDPVQGFAEAPAGFDTGPADQGGAPGDEGAVPLLALIADRPARALAWKYALTPHLPYRFIVRAPEQALADIAAGSIADLYLISADVDQPGEGLRLLSELRSRGGSRDAAFVVATPPERPDLAAIALDLGAGDTLPLTLAAPDRIETAVITLHAQILRKQALDRKRAEARRRMAWAMTDPLTGLFNRRYALPRLTEAVRAARHRGTKLALLVMDIDHFKRINDCHGHAAGDAALCQIARRIEEATGDVGLAARLGGEEFLVILAGLSDAEACAIAETARAAVDGVPIALPKDRTGAGLRVTVSIGVASLTNEDGWSDEASAAEALLDRADRAMLEAKSRGRNRIMLSSITLAA